MGLSGDGHMAWSFPGWGMGLYAAGISVFPLYECVRIEGV